MKKLTLIAFSLLASFAHADEKADAIAHGKTKFMTCGACHGVDGAGLKLGPTMMMAPGYKGSKVVDGDPEIFALVVLKGIKKEGTEYMGMMAPLGGALNDKDLAGLMTYIRNDFSEKKDLITEAEVKGWRAKYKDRTEMVTRAEIAELLKKSEDTAKKEAPKAAE
ncbi:cytochrome c [bacterium]|nr:cytochrome c [bacterium]MDB4374230.1 cytochrome c [Akkermansiaceae bacterium]MDB4374758.1 cytochrome c [bacterium]MDB4412468.1 cytochrome c [Akkermansiaceae bacterium]MDB4505264.1 cytochrome c [bacterium]